jgi:isoquinoline 1-oxidoreductase subunit beta
MKPGFTFTRRDFIRVVSVAGGGLILGVYLTEITDGQQAPRGSFSPNAWISIDSTGTVFVTIARSEMGQGIRTSLAMLIAEELDADWSKIVLDFPVAHQTLYGDMTTTGGTSIRDCWLPLRQAAAAAQEMLIRAAADTWGVRSSSCHAENGYVVSNTSDRRLSYGQLADRASRLPVPVQPKLKDPKNFRYIGKPIPRLDTAEKTDGSAIFGIDITLPGMFIATVARSPVLGGKVVSFNSSQAMIVPGVNRVVPISNGVGIVAKSAWAALKGREALTIVWDEGANSRLSNTDIKKTLEDNLHSAALVTREQGNSRDTISHATRRVDATYELPFLAHATMEPQNCTAHFRSGEIEIWAPTQSPQWIQSIVAQIYSLPPEKVMVHTTLLGGGFGRRLMVDYALEAVQISRAVDAPVKVLWTREDDFHNDFYHPRSLHGLSGAVNPDGSPLAWLHVMAAPSIAGYLNPNLKPGGLPDAVDGAANFNYDAIPNIGVEYVQVGTSVPIGWWRSVYHSQNAFVNESFIDEMAAAAIADPVEFRRLALPADSRLRAVIDLVMSKVNWPSRVQSGSGRGIACHSCYGSHVAMIAEVSVAAAGNITVERIICAIDCGPVVNPGIVEAQIEGAVAFGLTATLKDEITIEKGRVQQSNFDTYRLLPFHEMPDVEVHILPSTGPVGGVSEAGVPCVAPAVCNAIFAAVGKRIRRLPIRPEDLKM